MPHAPPAPHAASCGRLYAGNLVPALPPSDTAIYAPGSLHTPMPEAPYGAPGDRSDLEPTLLFQLSPHLVLPVLIRFHQRLLCREDEDQPSDQCPHHPCCPTPSGGQDHQRRCQAGEPCTPRHRIARRLEVDRRPVRWRFLLVSGVFAGAKVRELM